MGSEKFVTFYQYLTICYHIGPWLVWNNNNNNNNTSICKAHVVSIRAESEAPAVARWRGWTVVVV